MRSALPLALLLGLLCANVWALSSSEELANRSQEFIDRSQEIVNICKTGTLGPMASCPGAELYAALLKELIKSGSTFKLQEHPEAHRFLNLYGSCKALYDLVETNGVPIAKIQTNRAQLQGAITKLFKSCQQISPNLSDTATQQEKLIGQCNDRLQKAQNAAIARDASLRAAKDNPNTTFDGAGNRRNSPTMAVNAGARNFRGSYRGNYNKAIVISADAWLQRLVLGSPGVKGCAPQVCASNYMSAIHNAALMCRELPQECGGGYMNEKASAGCECRLRNFIQKSQRYSDLCYGLQKNPGRYAFLQNAQALARLYGESTLPPSCVALYDVKHPVIAGGIPRPGNAGAPLRQGVPANAARRPAWVDSWYARLHKLGENPSGGPYSLLSQLDALLNDLERHRNENISSELGNLAYYMSTYQARALAQALDPRGSLYERALGILGRLHYLSANVDLGAFDSGLAQILKSSVMLVNLDPRNMQLQDRNAIVVISAVRRLIGFPASAQWADQQMMRLALAASLQKQGLKFSEATYAGSPGFWISTPDGSQHTFRSLDNSVIHKQFFARGSSIPVREDIRMGNHYIRKKNGESVVYWENKNGVVAGWIRGSGGAKDFLARQTDVILVSPDSSEVRIYSADDVRRYKDKARPYRVANSNGVSNYKAKGAIEVTARSPQDTAATIDLSRLNTARDIPWTVMNREAKKDFLPVAKWLRLHTAFRHNTKVKAVVKNGEIGLIGEDGQLIVITELGGGRAVAYHFLSNPQFKSRHTLVRDPKSPGGWKDKMEDLTPPQDSPNALSLSLQDASQLMGWAMSPIQSSVHGIEAGMLMSGGYISQFTSFGDMGVNCQVLASGYYTYRQATFRTWFDSGKNPQQIMNEAYKQARELGGGRCREALDSMTKFLARKERERNRDEGSNFRNGEITFPECALVAFNFFGTDNAGRQAFRDSMEAAANGDWAKAALNGTAGAIVEGGQMYVEGHLFSAFLSGPAKSVFVKSATSNEEKSLQMLQSLSRTEMYVMAVPGVTNAAGNAWQLGRAWQRGDRNAMQEYAAGLAQDGVGVVALLKGMRDEHRQRIADQTRRVAQQWRAAETRPLAPEETPAGTRPLREPPNPARVPTTRYETQPLYPAPPGAPTRILETETPRGTRPLETPNKYATQRLSDPPHAPATTPLPLEHPLAPATASPAPTIPARNSPTLRLIYQLVDNALNVGFGAEVPPWKIKNIRQNLARNYGEHDVNAVIDEMVAKGRIVVREPTASGPAPRIDPAVGHFLNRLNKVSNDGERKVPKEKFIQEARLYLNEKRPDVNITPDDLKKYARMYGLTLTPEDIAQITAPPRTAGPTAHPARLELPNDPSRPEPNPRPEPTREPPTPAAKTDPFVQGFRDHVTQKGLFKGRNGTFGEVYVQVAAEYIVESEGKGNLPNREWRFYQNSNAFRAFVEGIRESVQGFYNPSEGRSLQQDIIDRVNKLKAATRRPKPPRPDTARPAPSHSPTLGRLAGGNPWSTSRPDSPVPTPMPGAQGHPAPASGARSLGAAVAPHADIPTAEAPAPPTRRTKSRPKKAPRPPENTQRNPIDDALQYRPELRDKVHQYIQLANLDTKTPKGRKALALKNFLREHGIDPNSPLAVEMRKAMGLPEPLAKKLSTRRPTDPVQEAPDKPGELDAAKNWVRQRSRERGRPNDFEKRFGPLDEMDPQDLLNLYRTHQMFEDAVGKDGKPARRGNLTPEQLDGKTTRLRGRFSPADADWLMREGYAGLEADSPLPAAPSDGAWSPERDPATKQYVEDLSRVKINPSNEDQIIERFRRVAGDPYSLSRRFPFLGLFNHIIEGISESKIGRLSLAVNEEVDRGRDQAIVIYDWLIHGDWTNPRFKAAAQPILDHIRAKYKDIPKDLDWKRHTAYPQLSTRAERKSKPQPSAPQPEQPVSMPSSPAAEPVPAVYDPKIPSSHVTSELQGLMRRMGQNEPTQTVDGRRAAEKFRDQTRSYAENMPPEELTAIYRRLLDPELTKNAQVREVIVDSIGELQSMAQKQPANVIAILQQVRGENVGQLGRPLQLIWPYLRAGLNIPPPAAANKNITITWLDFLRRYPPPSGIPPETAMRHLRDAANAFAQPEVSQPVGRILERPRPTEQDILGALPNNANGQTLRDWINSR